MKSENTGLKIGDVLYGVISNDKDLSIRIVKPYTIIKKGSRKIIAVNKGNSKVVIDLVTLIEDSFIGYKIIFYVTEKEALDFAEAVELKKENNRLLTLLIKSDVDEHSGLKLQQKINIFLTEVLDEIAHL